MLELFVGMLKHDVKFFKFPSGESGVKISPKTLYGGESVKITLRWEDNNDLIELALLKDAVQRCWNISDIELYIPFFPYARQDRVCNPGESLSVKVIADFINTLKFSRVSVRDPHSDVLGALVNNLQVLNNGRYVKDAVQFLRDLGEEVILVSPDSGGVKRLLNYTKTTLGRMQVVYVDKIRDPINGNILETTLQCNGHKGNATFLVIDDICDGGGTFIPLAKELRKFTNGKVALFVTHGLFTKDVWPVKNEYDRIFVVNNMYGNHPDVTTLFERN